MCHSVRGAVCFSSKHTGDKTYLDLSFCDRNVTTCGQIGTDFDGLIPGSYRVNVFYKQSQRSLAHGGHM